MHILLLSHNPIESDGALAFADYFKSYNTVRSLAVNSASIDDEGLKSLLESLSGSAEAGNLSTLDISENMSIDRNTVNSLCKLIRSAKHLTELNISELSIEKGKY